MKPTMKAKTLRVTDDWVNRRCLIHVDGVKVWVPGACRDAIGTLSLSDEFTPDKKLNAQPGNVARYVYRWEKELGVKLFENDLGHGWRLVIPTEEIEWECEFGRVPGSPKNVKSV